MGTNPTKAADNIYCRCRKEAAKYNDKLNSRDGAAELLGISASTLADYELGFIMHRNSEITIASIAVLWDRMYRWLIQKA